MTTSRIREAAVAAALAGALACTAPARSPEDHAVVAAVQRYNAALPRAYAAADPSPLADDATPDEQRRVGDLVDFLAQGRRVMDARQETFDAGEVGHAGPDRATVEATEVWWYRHRVPATGEVVQAPRRVRYRNLYRLVRAGGRWRVDRLEERGYEELR